MGKVGNKKDKSQFQSKLAPPHAIERKCKGEEQATKASWSYVSIENNKLRNGLYDLLRNSLSTYICEEVQFHLLCKEN